MLTVLGELGGAQKSRDMEELFAASGEALGAGGRTRLSFFTRGRWQLEVHLVV